MPRTYLLEDFMNRTFRVARAILLALLTTFVVACGDSEDFTQVTGQPVINPNNNFVGRYTGTNPLPGDLTGNLDVTVDAQGQASGTYTTAAVTAQTLVLEPGSYPVTGQVSLTTGQFLFSGNIPGVGDFSISGTLPATTGQAFYTFTLNGQTFQGTIQPAAGGNPNNGGGNNGNEGQLIQGGTLTNFVFTPDGSYNGENPPVDAGSNIAGAVGEGQGGEESATIVLSETAINGTTATVRSLVVSIVSPTGQELQVNQTYPLASDQNSDGAVIALSESVGTDVVEGWSLTENTTGQATITSLTDTSITIEFSFNSVGPNSEVENNPATGTFNVSGTVTGNFATIP